jgi:DNA-binding NtrC family response regulator
MTPEAPVQILLVESNHGLQAALASALARAGYEVRPVSSASEALSSLDGGALPIVVTEIGLPDESGIELARKIRGRYPGAEVVFLCGSDDARLAVAAIRVGAGGYVVKHWDGVEELLAALRDARERHDAVQRRQDFLRGLAELNEGFLRQMVQVEKENIDLQGQISGMAAADAADEAVYRILVVDDEDVILTVLASLLKEEGYEVQTATSAEEALERLEAERFQMMIADKNLPGQSGLDLIRIAKQKYLHLETVLITGYGSLESAIDALHAGAGGYLLKPFEDIGIVLQKVKELRARQAERRRARRYLETFKARNRAFLDQYLEIREKLREFLALG